MRLRTTALFLALGVAGIGVGPSGALAEQIDQNLGSLWAGLPRPVFDPAKVAMLENVQLSRDSARIEFVSGTIAFGKPFAGRVFAAAFKGTGRLRVNAVRPLEIQQLGFHTGTRNLDQEFSEALFLFSDSTMDEVAAQVTFAGGEVATLQEIYWKRNNTLVDHGLNWEPRILKALLADDPTHHSFFRAEFRTKEHGWVSLAIDQSEAEEFELSSYDESRHIVNIWMRQPMGDGSIEGSYRNWAAKQDYRIQGYQIEATVQSDTELVATTRVELVLQQAGERVLIFMLSPNLRVTRVESESGQSWSFFQPRDPKDEVFLGSYVVVVAPEALSAGSTRLTFHYAGKRVIRQVGAGNYFCQSFGWYPTYPGEYTFATRSDFDLSLRVPKKYQAVATGKKVQESKDGDYLLTRWQSEIPLAVAGFAYGDYKIETEQVGNTEVQVYANRAPDDLFRTLEVVTEGSVPQIEQRSLPTFTLGQLNPARMAKVMVTEVSNALRVFEAFYGPYPYQKLAVANVPFFAGGQGWPSLLYVSTVTFLDSAQRNQLGIGDHVELTDRFRAHETSHQWWGHVVGWRSYHDQWLSEGFAEYSGMLYTQFRRNPGEFLAALRQARDRLIQKDRFGSVPDQIGPLYAGWRLSSSYHPGGYFTVVYSKGAWVLHMLRMMLRDTQNPQPDARFMAVMQEFTKTYFNQPASTEDFKRIVEKHMTSQMNLDGNGKMDWFFNQWVYGTGIPTYQFGYRIEPGPEPNTYLLQGQVRQSGVPDSFRMPVPLYITKGQNTMLAGWIMVTGREMPFQAKLDFKPDKVSINDWEDVLAITVTQ